MPYVRNVRENTVNLVTKDHWSYLKTCADSMNYKLEMGKDMEVAPPVNRPGTFATPEDFEKFLHGDDLEVPVTALKVNVPVEFAKAEMLPEVPIKRKRGRPKKIREA